MECSSGRYVHTYFLFIYVSIDVSVSWEQELSPSSIFYIEEGHLSISDELILQVWRALRLIIDTGLHSRGMKRFVEFL
jgi:hypothetical protein